MYIKNKKIFIFVSILLFIAFQTSCARNSTEKISDAAAPETEKREQITSPVTTPKNQAEITDNHSIYHLSSFKELNAEIFEPQESPLYNEINMLGKLLEPYFDPSNQHFVGESNKKFLENSLLYATNIDEPIPVEDLEKLVHLLFGFNEEDMKLISKYLSEFAENGIIERQYALCGLIKLLSTKYPLKLQEIGEKIELSNIISDIEQADEENRLSILEAHFIGFTDYTMQVSNSFRPTDPLSKGETISSFYRILANFGPPVPDTPQNPGNGKSSQFADEAYYIENIIEEYTSWEKTLNNSKKPKDQKKLEKFQKAKFILNSEDIGITGQVSLDNWAKILNETFEVAPENIEELISNEQGNILTFEVFSISVYKFPELYGYLKQQNITEKELNEAASRIAQFETARDTDIFTRLYVSGLIDGLYQIPGFTPQRPVNKTEALLMIKRIIEKM